MFPFKISIFQKIPGDEKDHADAIVIFNGFLNICFTLILIALDYYMYQNSGWIWRSRKESGWFFVILSFFWSYFGLDITQAIGHESWGDFLVGFTVLAPSHTTWFDAFMLGVGIYVLLANSTWNNILQILHCDCYVAAVWSIYFKFCKRI